jgi:hypothetical protein
MMREKYGASFLTLVLGMSIGVSAAAQPVSESFFDTKKKQVVCSEPLQVFTLGEKSNPKQEQVKELCSCIWNKFPADGWERRTSQLIRNNQDPGWRGTGLISRFGEAFKSCGGMNM